MLGLAWPATFSTLPRRANHRPSRRRTIGRHAPAAAGTCSSSKPFPAGANLALRRHPPCPSGYPRHDQAWLDLLQGPRLNARGNTPHALHLPAAWCGALRTASTCLPAAPGPRRTSALAPQRVRTSRPHPPEAQFPIARRKAPAGSSMSRFRTLKRPKSFD